MSETIAMRVTSLAASAALLAAGAYVALSVTYMVANQAFTTPQDPIVMIAPPRAPSPPPARKDAADPAPPGPIEFSPVSPADPPPIPASYEGEGNVPALIVNPHWLNRPRDLARYYPRRALSRGVTGEAILDCAVSHIGALACSVVSETPANWGFGDAAVAISRDYRMSPATRDGAPVEGRYQMRVPFQLN